MNLVVGKVGTYTVIQVPVKMCSANVESLLSAILYIPRSQFIFQSNITGKSQKLYKYLKLKRFCYFTKGDQNKP